MIVVRPPETIYQIRGAIEHGTFRGRWHFSFDRYHDPKYMQFGPLRVFNDDTLSPGAVWPLHPHREIEVVTYCAQGEFRHADQNGQGGVLKKGWVQHTTVGHGMWHSEINDRPDQEMRFIQMWFLPSQPGLEPAVQQRAVEKAQRTNRFLLLVSNRQDVALPIVSPAEVYSSFLEQRHAIEQPLDEGHGAYLYVVEGGPVVVNGHEIPALGACKLTNEPSVHVDAHEDAELLLVDILLT